MKCKKASITIFTSLLLVLLLSILCTTLESARISGVRGMAATACNSSAFSLFSEYNNILLEDYELFF
ncbi:hypothetical protein P261_01336 [Lachnospiraceae bacterium TWA4]|nr:hypothetical protein P261_01336 [Lachnospiraceae bacterium TWA4]